MGREPDEDPGADPPGDLYDEFDYRPSIEVAVTEPVMISTLYDIQGDPLVIVYDRSVVPFGFQVP